MYKHYASYMRRDLKFMLQAKYPSCFPEEAWEPLENAHFPIPDGWYGLLDEGLKDLEALLSSSSFREARLNTCMERRGRLELGLNSYPASPKAMLKFSAILDPIVKKALITCRECGKAGKLYGDGGFGNFERVLCPQCYDKEGLLEEPSLEEILKDEPVREEDEKGIEEMLELLAKEHQETETEQHGQITVREENVCL